MTHENLESPECGLTAFAGLEVPPAQMAALRRKPHAHVPLPTGLLKYVDEQTVAAVAAVYAAIHEHGLHGVDFTDWGVAAAPRFLGREMCTLFLDRFHRQGPLSMSPLLAVYQSLHAVSGTVSLALKIHGPNLGVGGGHGCLEQTLMAGIALQHEHRLPGVWMVFSEWDPEPVPDEQGKADKEGAVCRAVAMAFQPVAAGWQGLRLRLVPGWEPAAAHSDPLKLSAPATLADLAAFLAGFGKRHAAATTPDSAWMCSLNWNARLELTTRSHSAGATADKPMLAA